MTVITHNRRRSRLSSLIDQPGGISTRTALKQAADQLAGLEAQSLEIIRQAIHDLSTLPAPTALADNKLAVNTAYRLSSSVIDAAGPFARTDLCAVAINLCDLLDAASETEVFDWRIVTVHAQAFRLLMSLPADEVEARQQVVDSLKDVLRVKVGETDA
ncbi:MAG: hypothetical protein ACRYFE_00870 [Janthinobacterium lividum]